MNIPANIASVRQRIDRACGRSGRSPEDVTLIGVTKTASIEQVIEARTAGIGVFGENRIQEAKIKHDALPDAEWHLIGHLQTNKVKEAVRIFSVIHSVDSERLAAEIDTQAAKLGKIQDILVQVNVSGEESKFGLAPDIAAPFIKKIALYPNINILGLMTIAPEVDDPETVRPFFKALRELRESINENVSLPKKMEALSMGMTGDFETAIEEGATMIRVGRAIFNA